MNRTTLILFMRLREPQINLLCQKLLRTLRTNQLITIKTGESTVLKQMIEIFLGNLKAEEELNLEVEKLMQVYASKMGTSIDREKMFQMIRKQLIKDKGFIV